MTKTNSICQKKLETAKAYLIRCLSCMEPGERLPSIRELIRGSGTSRTAVENALSYLERHGLIRRAFRSGIFRAGETQQTDSRVIDLVACHDFGYTSSPDSFYRHFVNYLHEMVSREGYSLRLNRIGVLASFAEYERIVRREDSCGFVLFSVNFQGIAELFRRTGKPLVYAFPKLYRLCGASVCDGPLLPLLMEQVRKMGHTRMGYLNIYTDETPDPVALMRLVDYYKFMSEHSLKTNPHWVQNARWNERTVTEKMDDMLSNPPMPTMVFCVDQAMAYLYEYLRRRGITPGKELGVCALDGLPEIFSLRPKAASGSNPRDVAALKVWSLLKRQLTGERCTEVLYNDYTFIPGDSLQNASPLPGLNKKNKKESMTE